MGIPVGWNIVRDEAKEKDVLRADVIGSRSPIRRRARGSLPPRSLGRYTLGALLENAPRLPSPRLSQPRLSPLPPAPPVPELRAHDLERAPDLERHHLPLPRPHSSSSASGSDSARDAADERPLPALTPGFAPAGLRPTPNRYAESVLLGTYARDHSHVDGHRGNASNRGRLARTPSRGSPARAVSGRRIELDGLPYAQRRTVRNPFLENDTVLRAEDGGDDDDTARTTNAVSHPTLRRVGHRRIADGPLPSSHRESWSPVSTIDGLGDRERSNSVSSTSSHPAWQTFLHTVVPDPVAPTAESSFASSAASASFAASSSRASSSNSNSAASSLTHVTIPSRRPSAGAVRRRDEDTIEGLARACESSDEDNSTASDTDDEATANTLSRRRMRPSYFADEPPSPRRYGRSVMEQGIDARRYIRRYYSHERPPYRPWQMNGPAMSPEPEREERGQEADSFATTVVDDDTPPSTGLASPLDQELRDARNLLERLTRRGDVGDDFWASVGLTRSFADGVERVQERGRF